MRIAVGDSLDWQPYSLAKVILPGEITTPIVGGRLVIDVRPAVEWNVNRSCTITHVYFIDGDNEARYPLDAPVVLRLGEAFRLKNVSIGYNIASPGHDPYLA